MLASAGVLRAVRRAGTARSFWSYYALHTRSLIVERFLPRGGRRVLGKEAIAVARLYACGSACFAACMQAEYDISLPWLGAHTGQCVIA